MRQPSTSGKASGGRAAGIVVFAAGPGVGQVVDRWRRGALRPVLVDVTESNLRAALLSEAALAEMRAAGVATHLRLAPGAGTPTRLEIGSVVAAHEDVGYAIAGPAPFTLRLRRALRAFGVEPVSLAEAGAPELAAA
jgi:hypothetical protein